MNFTISYPTLCSLGITGVILLLAVIIGVNFEIRVIGFISKIFTKIYRLFCSIKNTFSRDALRQDPFTERSIELNQLLTYVENEVGFSQAVREPENETMSRSPDNLPIESRAFTGPEGAQWRMNEATGYMIHPPTIEVSFVQSRIFDPVMESNTTQRTPNWSTAKWFLVNSAEQSINIGDLTIKNGDITNDENLRPCRVQINIIPIDSELKTQRILTL